MNKKIDTKRYSASEEITNMGISRPKYYSIKNDH